jgi:hypothetical protein
VKFGALFAAVMLSLLVCTTAAPFTSGAVEASARQGFEQILDLWRSEDYEGLYGRLEHPRGQGWDYFAQRIVYGSRIPACCWEKLQEVTVTVVDQDRVTINARVGFEVEGVGTRFVAGVFHLRRSGGIWKLPLQVVLDLSDYNFQRIPRKIYERQP